MYAYVCIVTESSHPSQSFHLDDSRKVLIKKEELNFTEPDTN